MHYYQHHIGDFLKDTGSLSNEEIGIYLKLIWLYYDSEKPLPNNISLLAFKVNAREHVEKVQFLLDCYFFYDKEYDCYTHGRIEAEVQAYHHRKEVGKANISKRWNNTIAIPLVKQVNTTQVLTKNQEPRTKNINTMTPEGVSSEVFNDFVRLRKGLKAPVTDTAIKGLQREATKAKMSLQAVMELCCQNGWRGFKAEWMVSKDGIKTFDKPVEKKWFETTAGIEAKGAELGISSEGCQTIGQYEDRIRASL